MSYLYDSRGDQSKSVNCPEEDCVFKYGNILVKDLNKGNSNNVVYLGHWLKKLGNFRARPAPPLKEI